MIMIWLNMMEFRKEIEKRRNKRREQDNEEGKGVANESEELEIEFKLQKDTSHYKGS